MDKYAELRAALEIGPTTGPWDIETDIYGKVISIGPINTETSLGWAYIDAEEKDIKAVSACNPDTIRALLAERDALIHDNSEYVSAANELATENQRLREALEAMMDYAGQPISHPAAQLARAALAQEQGENHDNQD